MHLGKIGLAIVLFSTSAFGQGFFDPEPGQGAAPPKPPATQKASEPTNTAPPPAMAELGFVLNGSQQTIIARLSETVAAIDSAMEKAASEGAIDRHEKLKPKREEFRQLLDRAKAEQVLPSLYPLAIGKKGCLMAIREMATPVTVPGCEPIPSKFQMVSWFQVKILAAEGKDTVSADLCDGSGKLRLYRVKLTGPIAAEVQAGSSVRLRNVPFEVTLEEEDGASKIYHLKQLDLQQFAKALPKS